jgi:hypothetical protein
MPHIALSLIDPNPFRDFDLHPIDQAQVVRLKRRLRQRGFGRVSSPDRLEIGISQHLGTTASRLRESLTWISADRGAGSV